MLVQRPVPRHGYLAFLPATLRYHGMIVKPFQSLNALGYYTAADPEYHGASAYQLAAYWHEWRGERHATVMGGVNLIVNHQHMPGAPADLTYEQLLRIADGQKDLIRGYIGVTPVLKHGDARGARPVPPTNTLLHGTALDARELPLMLADSDYLPPNADGWYMRKRGIA